MRMPGKFKSRIPDSKSARLLLGIGLIVLSLVLLFMIFTPGGSDNPERVSAGGNYVVPVSVNFPAPDLELENLNGKVETLKDFHGQVVLVNNWATWCPPCKAEMPTLSDYYNDHADEGFAVIAIESGDPREKVLDYVEEYDLPFTVWLDAHAQAMQAFQNQNLPSSYVIDRSGIVRFAWTGEINRELLEKYVTPMLSE